MKNYLSLQKKIYLNQIDKRFNNQSILIDKICSKDNIKANSLIFINKKKYNNEKINKNCIVITNLKLKSKNIFFPKDLDQSFVKF